MKYIKILISEHVDGERKSRIFLNILTEVNRFWTRVKGK
ncbi:Uncharacterised protein [Lederbergia lenta]|uniref:Uncharacterized protein n=1 Tax=Lederbergia lenta TaxID=1467 RepID=A0A2X4Z1X9_LEDLE|nr:Uncharacterised protein [Lederbergia lenta]